MDVPAAAVRELKKRCDLKPKVLREALAASRGDVDAALLRLIDGGQVETFRLNPRIVRDELFIRAKQGKLKALIASREAMLKDGSWDAMWRKILRAELADARAQLRDKKEFVGLRDEELARLERDESIARSKTLRAAHGRLKLLPLPPLKLEAFEWTGRDRLPSFTRYRAGREPVSSGAVEVTIPRLDEDEENPAMPAPEQIAAYAYLKDSQTKVAEVVLRAVVGYVRKLKRNGYFDADTDPAPAIERSADLKRHVSVQGVQVMEYAKAGHAYVGLSFRCTWDEEHQLGLMLHKSRVVAVGQADTSFDHYAAKDDGGRELKVAQKQNAKGRR